LKHFWRTKIVFVTDMIKASTSNIISICMSELTIG
jgi:hypothetical protein